MRRKINEYFKDKGLKLYRQSIYDIDFPEQEPPTVQEIREKAGKYAKTYDDDEIEVIIDLFLDRNSVLYNLWNLFISTEENDETTNNILGHITFDREQLNKIFFTLLKAMPTIEHIANYLKYQVEYSEYIREVYANGYLEHEDTKYGTISNYETGL